ncbi:MAG: glycosyltransferase family 2 protein [Bacteroidetes bacterium]|nr:glycosyltransferase family 2 protein [Bacteroidota bacterium]
MTANILPKKIAFCITCMNRLCHLQQTLEKNILDNYLIDDVEFVLLDYNSTDGLGEWVQQNMQTYIDSGILVYYKTTEPKVYHRSHSRNMAFRLANAGILCNLDADNFLGKGFAAFMIQEFATHSNIFYTNNHSFNDTFGRVSVRYEDFTAIRGYNEALKSYGYEDNDFMNRLMKHGLQPMSFQDPEFYRYISHSDKSRISEEHIAKNLSEMYIAYVNPYTSIILLLYNDFTTEQYTLVDNVHVYGFSEVPLSIYEAYLNEKVKIVIQGDVVKGTWSANQKSPTIDFENRTFHKAQNDDFITWIIVLLTQSINFNEVYEQIKNNTAVNPDGFGKGSAFKNFDVSRKKIID